MSNDKFNKTVDDPSIRQARRGRDTTRDCPPDHRNTDRAAFYRSNDDGQRLQAWHNATNPKNHESPVSHSSPPHTGDGCKWPWIATVVPLAVSAGLITGKVLGLFAQDDDPTIIYKDSTLLPHEVTPRAFQEGPPYAHQSILGARERGY